MSKGSMVDDWMGFFEEISILYRKLYLEPLWTKYEFGKRPHQAVALFWEGYAFERQGRNPSYAHAAVDSIMDFRGAIDKVTLEEEELVRKIWQEFSSSLGNENLNIRNNPLYPGRNSLIEKIQEGDNPNFVKRTEELIKMGELKNAYDFIDAVRGVGPKIASLFLRDLKEATEVKLDSTSSSQRMRLQPIDIWVRRTICQLGNAKEMSDRDVALFVVENSKNPERVNMGIWFFSAVVCASKYKHTKCLQSLEIARVERKNYLERARSVCYLNNG